MLNVRVFHDLGQLSGWRDEIDALNAQSRRPCPYHTLAYLEAHVAHDEYFVGGVGKEPWFLAVFEGERLVGWLALKRITDHALGGGYPKLEFLATHDTDRPHLVCAVDDEARCAEAIYGWLVQHADQWSFLDLRQQDPHSALWPLPSGVDFSRFFVRRFPCDPNNLIPVQWEELGAYLQTFDKKYRGNVKRQVRALLGEGRATWVRSEDPRALPALFELYLDLERRSWKVAAGAGIERHPERLRFFEALRDPKQRQRLGIGLVVLDGLPIAGAVTSRLDPTLNVMSIAFDEQFGRLAPGTFLFLMLMDEAIRGRAAALNLQTGFSYYKSKWQAVTTETESLQIYRLGTRPFYKAVLGDFRRRLAQADGAEGGRFNPSRREVQENAPMATAHVPRVPRPAELEALRAFDVTWRDHEALDASMPFDTARTPPPNARKGAA